MLANLSSLNLLAVILSFIWIISVCPEVQALKCYSWYPCENDGGLETCDETYYADIPGYIGCSSETGAGGVLKKRCIWLRNNPDEDPPPKTPSYRCNTSPIDDNSDDCFCFTDTDGCNKNRLNPKTNPDKKDGQNKDGQNKDDQNKDGQNKDDQNKDGQNKDDQNKDDQNQNQSPNLQVSFQLCVLGSLGTILLQGMQRKL